MTTEVTPDVDAISADPTEVTLTSGLVVRVERLRTRATMALLKIITRGASAALADLVVSPETSTEAFTGQLIGTIVVSIPEAEEETIEFIQRMVSPAELRTGRLTRDDVAFNEALEARLAEELRDPELEDLVAIVEKIITVEAPHIQALGNRLALLFRTQQKSETAKRSSSSKRS